MRITNEQSLREKISEEISHSKPDLERIISFVKEFENINIATINKLSKNKIISEKRIQGGLKQTIKAHGPITEQFITSASKRIYGLLLEKNSNIINPIEDQPYKTTEVVFFSVRSILAGIGLTVLFQYIFNLL